MPVRSPLGPVCQECCQWWGRLLPPGVGKNLLGGKWYPVTRGSSEISPHDLPSFPRDVPNEHWMMQDRWGLGGGQPGNGGWESKWPSGLPCGYWVLVGAKPCHATRGKAAGDSKKELSPSATKRVWFFLSVILLDSSYLSLSVYCFIYFQTQNVQEKPCDNVSLMFSRLSNCSWTGLFCLNFRNFSLCVLGVIGHSEQDGCCQTVEFRCSRELVTRAIVPVPCESEGVDI